MHPIDEAATGAEGGACTSASAASAAATAMLPIRLTRGILRPFRAEDASSIALHANSRAVWLGCSDRFAHPYSEEDAQRWVATCMRYEPPEGPPSQLAIEVDGRAVGGIGVFQREGVQRFTKELGYWVGEALWGQGIGGEAVGAFLPYMRVAYPDTARVEALVYSYNERSSRILLRRGFVLEGRLRDAAYKDGKFTDSLVYGLVFRDGAARSSGEEGQQA